MERLEDAIAWYDKKSGYNQARYKWLKFLTMAAAALIPILSAATAYSSYSAALGIVIVLAEGLQQLNQYQTNWLTYRSTCEALKHEKFLYLAEAGPYAVPTPLPILAERIEGLIAQEHSKWVSSQEPKPATSEPRV